MPFSISKHMCNLSMWWSSLKNRVPKFLGIQFQDRLADPKKNIFFMYMINVAQ